MTTSPPLTAAEAAARSGIPKRTILHAISSGSLKAQKLAGARGAYLIRPRDLERYLSKREAKASA